VSEWLDEVIETQKRVRLGANLVVVVRPEDQPAMVFSCIEEASDALGIPADLLKCEHMDVRTLGCTWDATWSESAEEIRDYYSVEASPRNRSLPAAPGTVSRESMHSGKMGSGEGNPTMVIVDGQLKQYVGIGWVDIRPATAFDYDAYPVAV
jgi:hypothetical protein